VAVARAAVEGAGTLPEDVRVLCFALIESSLGAAARRSVEMLLENKGIERIFNETQRRILTEGLARGRAEGNAKALLRILARRGIVVSAEQTRAILSCTNLDQLETWVDRAVTAKTIEEILG
jgi:hypothetical protein